MDLAAWKEPVSRVVELVGVLLILIGAATATVRFVARWAAAGLDTAYREYRQQLGRAILLGPRVPRSRRHHQYGGRRPDVPERGRPGRIVVIRTFLSFSLEVEIEGHWPWARSQLSLPGPAASP